jgi:hypothetical protein
MTDSRWIDPILLPPEAFKLHIKLLDRVHMLVFTQCMSLPASRFLEVRRLPLGEDIYR